MMKDPLALALKKLANKVYSFREMQQILTSCGYDQEEITNVLQRLVSWGYLNDEKLAESIYSYHVNYKPCGRSLLLRKMLYKGIPTDIAASVLNHLDEEKELSLAHKLTNKYTANKKGFTRRQLAVKTAHYLKTKGFSTKTIRRIMENLHVFEDQFD
ncbi:hypothetical protein BR63_04800 [Thermanaerosceptrum fracticalcis]|uniref:Regulatory protein RecX n=1 Tax=Thermanaerosceptrum fracticalcis TaxID=1712410 RepID=A0A7G6E0T2_THEFR|nr:regulatory protein RecX [Thermanaerosceptrum fracticalcis]QNB45686.1 hypothetical protein BR63_04800 [Thermanaerosceptrum fracticalcis]